MHIQQQTMDWSGVDVTSDVAPASAAAVAAPKPSTPAIAMPTSAKKLSKASTPTTSTPASAKKLPKLSTPTTSTPTSPAQARAKRALDNLAQMSPGTSDSVYRTRVRKFDFSRSTLKPKRCDSVRQTPKSIILTLSVWSRFPLSSDELENCEEGGNGRQEPQYEPH